jgi:hypothetical protein
MMPPRPSSLGLLPIPDRRRRRLVPLMIVGALVFLLGQVIDNDLLWGIGAGMLLSGAIALLLDRWARRRHQPG